jgi:hypothetical protein
VLHSELQRKDMAKMMGLQFIIEYKKGKENQAAYALSRMGHFMALQSVVKVKPLWVQDRK